MNTPQDTQLAQFLSKLGYNLSTKGKEVFIDVILDALEYVGNGKTIEEVRELIMEKKTSPIYVELAYFGYEKGLPFIHDSLETFQSEKEDSLYDSKINNKEVDEEEKIDVYNSLFNIVRYITENNNNDIKSKGKKMSTAKKQNKNTNI